MTTDVHKTFGLIGFELWRTGGNCTAFGFNIDDDKGTHIMVTDGDYEGNAPCDDTKVFEVWLFDDDENYDGDLRVSGSIKDAIQAIGEAAGQPLDPKDYL
jgi:hypothetical protein